MITHAELDSLISRESFREWQSDLIYQAKRHKTKPSVERDNIRQETELRQQALVAAIARGPGAVRDFLCSVAPEPETTTLLRNLPALPGSLTEAEMKQTTLQVDREVSTALDNWGITPMLAGESSFWTLCHARWIGDGMFPDGVSRVFAGGAKTAGDTDATARTFLRRICGLPVERGNTSVITDCPLSASWWRYRLAREVSSTLLKEGESLTIKQAHYVLRGSVVWETLVMSMVRRLASLNAPRARAAVVLALHEHSIRNAGKAVPRELVSGCMQNVAQLGDRFSFAHVDWAKLTETATAAFEGRTPVVSEMAGTPR